MSADRRAAFLAPAALLLACVTVFPILYLFWLSLELRSPILGLPRFIGLENYVRLLEDERFWNALLNTAYFTAVSVALELVLGLAIALLLRQAFPGRGLVYAVVLIPWAIPTAVSARMWEWMYNAEFGVLNYLLATKIAWLGSPAAAIHAAIALDLWKATPFVAVLLLAGLTQIPEDLYRAAALDGAGPWTRFTRITLPLLRPLIAVVLIFRTIDAIRVFDSIYVLTGGGPADTTETLSIYAYKALFQALEFGYGAAVAVTTFMLVAAVTALYARFLRT